MYIGLHVKYPLLWSYFNETLIYLHIFEKYSNFIRIRPVGAALFHADGQTNGRADITKLVVAFRCFAKALTKTKAVLQAVL
jgi:hypothetical protein